YGPDESFAQMETSNSVHSRSMPMHPMSTARNSVISPGIHADPCPTSSYVENMNFRFTSGTMSSFFNVFNTLIRMATDALSSRNLDLMKPDSVTTTFGS